MQRLFIAIDFSENVINKIEGILHGLPGAKWNTTEQIHLTLQFLGDIEYNQKLDIIDALKAVKFNSFPIILSGIGVFPPRGPAKILWVGTMDNPELRNLKKKIDYTISEIGIKPEKRKYSPHVTIARLRKISPQKLIQYLTLYESFHCDETIIKDFHLYSSTLTPNRAYHEIEYSFALS
jgi:2'-5' RNA ligase